MLSFVDFELQTGSERDRLLHREVGEENVVLHDVRGVLTEYFLVEVILVVKLDFAFKAHAWLDCDAVTEKV